MAQWAALHLAPGCHVVSDGTPAFAQVRQAGAVHERHVTGGGRQGAHQGGGCAHHGAHVDLGGGHDGAGAHAHDLAGVGDGVGEGGKLREQVKGDLHKGGQA